MRYLLLAVLLLAPLVGAATPERTQTFSVPADAVDIAVSRDGTLLAVATKPASPVTSNGDELHVFNAGTGERVMAADPETGTLGVGDTGISFVRILKAAGSTRATALVATDSPNARLYAYDTNRGSAGQESKLINGQIFGGWVVADNALVLWNGSAVGGNWLSYVTLQGTAITLSKTYPRGTDINVEHVGWSPDLQLLAVHYRKGAAPNQENRIALVDETLTQVADGPIQQSLASVVPLPDGSGIAAVGGSTLYVYPKNTTGQGFTQLFQKPLDGTATDVAAGFTVQGVTPVVVSDTSGLSTYLVDLDDESVNRAPEGDGAADSSRSMLDFNRPGTWLYAFTTGGTLRAYHSSQLAELGEVTRAPWELPTTANRWAASDTGGTIAIITRDSARTIQLYQRAPLAELQPGQVPPLQPGEATPIRITVRNTGSESVDGTLRLDAPEGWVSTTADVPFLLPGAEAAYSLDLTPPAAAPPGPADVTVVLSGGNTQAEKDLRPQVASAAQVDLTLLGTVPVRAQAGQDSVLPFRLDNAGNVALDVQVTASISQRGWTATGPTGTITVPVGSSVTNNVTIRPPQGTPDGSRATVTITVAGTGVQAQQRVDVLINPTFDQPALEGLAESYQGEPAEAVQLEVTVRNRGNTLDTIRLSVTSEGSDAQKLWRTQLSDDELELDGGDSKTVTVTVTIPRAAAEGEFATVTLTAVSAGSGQAATGTARVEVPDEGNGIPLPTLLLLAPPLLLRRRRCAA